MWINDLGQERLPISSAPGDFRIRSPKVTEENSQFGRMGSRSIVNFFIHQGLCLRCIFVKHVKMIKALGSPVVKKHI